MEKTMVQMVVSGCGNCPFFRSDGFIYPDGDVPYCSIKGEKTGFKIGLDAHQNPVNPHWCPIHDGDIWIIFEKIT